MAMMRYAKATVVHPHVTTQQWGNIRTAGQKSKKALQPNLIDKASEIFGKTFNPADYLISHATIVSSVDVENVPNVPLGVLTVEGTKINRKWSDYRIVKETEGFANNNLDAWARQTLLNTYPTFIGGHNFCFAPGTQVLLADGFYKNIEDILVGDLVITHTGKVQRVTHLFERDFTGDIQALSVDRFKKPLLVTGNHPFRKVAVEAPPLTSYSTSTLANQARYRKDQITSALRDNTHSFGHAFTRITKTKALLQEKGPLVAGDIAEHLGHKRDYAPSVFKFLKEHPEQFSCRNLLPDEYPQLKKGRSRCQIWYLTPGAPQVPQDAFLATKDWAPAEHLQVGNYLLGPERLLGNQEAEAKATLLGYYLAEGCPLSPTKEYGVVFTFGAHEDTLQQHVKNLALAVFPDSKVSISQPCNGSQQVRVYGLEVHRWFHKYGAGYSSTKQIHPDVFSWDKESLLQMFSAWLAGDGDAHTGTLRLRGVSTSKKLAEQMHRIAELCGIKTSVVFTKIKIGEISGYTQMVVGGASRSFAVTPRSHIWTVIVSKESAPEITTRNRRWGSALYNVQDIRKRQEFAWWENCRVHYVSKNEILPYTGKVYNFETETDHSYVVYPGLAVHNCEHVQIESLSKGRIIDAVARDIGPSIYIDILIATDRKHTDLIEAIESGRMSTLSMGCSIAFSVCNKCGNVAVDETEMCSHIKYLKGNKFFDEMGVQRTVLELCGHASDSGSVTFIEASWVETPAFEGAVLRNVLEPRMLPSNLRKRAEYILSQPPEEWSGKNTTGKRKKAALEITAEPDFSDFNPSDDGSGDSAEAPAPAAPAKEKAPFEDLETDISQYVVDKVRKNLKKDLEDSQKDSTGSLLHPDDNLVKQAHLVKYASGLRALIATSKSDIDLVDRVAAYNQTMGIQIPIDIYRASVRVGGSGRYRTAQDFVTACRHSLGRNPTTSEINQLIRLGKLLSIRDTRGPQN